MRGGRGRPIVGGGRVRWWLRLTTKSGREERRELQRLRDEWRVQHAAHQRAYDAQQRER